MTARAAEARHRARAFSGFHVGAALLTRSGEIVTGCSVELRTTLSSICAERTAMVKAVSMGHTEFQAIAVVSDADKPVSPCAFCRQDLVDFDPEILVIMANAGGSEVVEMTAAELLPMEDISAFGNLRRELQAGRVYGHLSECLSDFLARTLLPTTDLVPDRHVKKRRAKFFVNPELCEITEDLVLTEPFWDFKGRNVIQPENRGFVEEVLYGDEALRGEAGLLREGFMNHSQALLHGDTGIGGYVYPENHREALTGEYAWDLTYRVLMESPEPVVCVSLAAMTKLAATLRKYPEVKSKIEKVVFMGGELRGNTAGSQCASVNIFHDPDSAQYVLTSGVPFHMCTGAAVTSRVLFSVRDDKRDYLAQQVLKGIKGVL